MPVTADLSLSVTGQHSSVLDLGTAVLPFAISSSVQLTSGTGAGMADRVFADTRTLSASTSEDIDLAGVLLDAFGALITFVKLKGLIIKAAAANTNAVHLSRPSAATGVPIFLAVSDGIIIPPGYTFAWFGPGTGITVTPASGDIFMVTNGGAGTSVTYDLIVIGTSS